MMTGKFARVTPVYKQAGDINMPGNYRPISVIGHIAKMIETLIGVQMIDYLEEYNFISIDQSAYLKRHSTITSLHRVIDDLLESMNDEMLIGAVFYDISKCFDSINHSLLLRKMFKYGFRGIEQTWFKSYLNSRKQKVNLNGQQSSFLLITDGVPPGSVLGPLLFLLFINDISNFTTDYCSLNLFADDSISYVAAYNISELQMKLQKCVDSISQWYFKNRLTVNASKCKMMILGTSARLKIASINYFNVMYEGNPLDLVEKTEYLGLHLSTDLNWDTHIMELCKNLNCYLHLLRRLKKVLPKHSGPTEKVQASHRSLNMADAATGKRFLWPIVWFCDVIFTRGLTFCKFEMFTMLRCHLSAAFVTLFLQLSSRLFEWRVRYWPFRNVNRERY